MPSVEISRVERAAWTPAIALGAAASSVAGAAAGAAVMAVPVVAMVPSMIWSIGAYRVAARVLPMAGVALSCYLLGPTTTLFAACLVLS